MPTTKKKDDLLEQQNQVPNTTQQTAPAQSSTVQQAQNLLQQQMKNGYQSQWQPQINNLMEQYMNRDKFSYDVNKDALFQQLKDQYSLMGQQAMMDTMGQAAALTGGYGNSYAQGVGQQAYQGFVQQLNDKIPDLYQIALNQYLNEGSQLQEGLNMLMQQDSLDYGRYRDMVGDQQWKDSFDYGKQRDEIADQQWRENFEYQQNRDKVNDQQWKDSFDYGKQRDEIADQQWRENFEYAQSRDQAADKDDSYNRLLALMTQFGYIPSDSELEYAGMSKEQMNAIMGVGSAPVSSGNGSNDGYGDGYIDTQPINGDGSLSAAGLEFERKLTEAQKNSSVQGQKWNDMSKKRLEQAYNSGQLTDEDVIIIAAKFGIT